jgi:hypothetical protein
MLRLVFRRRGSEVFFALVATFAAQMSSGKHVKPARYLYSTLPVAIS